jgi:4-hydroxymandelate oxidase
MQPLNLLEYERLAEGRLPQPTWDYYRSGADDERTLGANRQAFAACALRPRALVDVSQRSMSLELFGKALALPVLLAPTAFQRLAHADGELGAARAARAIGTAMVLSTLSTTPVEDVAREAAALFFQLYVYKDRGATLGLVERAREAGCVALVLTVDAPMLGRRERDVRNGFTLPPELTIANLVAKNSQSLPAQASSSGLAQYFHAQIDPAVDERTLEWLCDCAKLPVIVKGIVRADDARRAVEHGAAGIVVSNHGGRQLDTAIATLRALPEVAAAVGGEVPVLLDGGVRRGTDVIKALALGARAVLIGRPILWGLAVGGEAGVRDVLSLLGAELDLALALCGCRSLAEVSRDLIANE